MSISKVYSCTDLIGYLAEEKAKGELDRFKCKFPNTRPLSLEDASSKVLGMKVIVDLTHDLVAAIFKGSEGGLQARDQDGYPIKLESTDEICRRLGTIFLYPIEANTWLKKAGYPSRWKSEPVPNLNDGMIPGLMPRTGIGILAIKAAYQIESEKGKLALVHQVFDKFDQWIHEDKEPVLIKRTVREVTWMTSNNKEAVFTYDACGKALKKWNSTRP